MNSIARTLICGAALGLALTLRVTTATETPPASSLSPGAVPASSTVVENQFYSERLTTQVRYLAYLPAGYGADPRLRYPVLYLLHGRGDNLSAWLEAKPEIDRLIGSGRIPPVIAILPDVPFSKRASYYIDSQFRGTGGAVPLPAGQPVESMLTRELIGAVDSRYPTQAERAGRIVAGYSMGGYGAVHLALARPDLFGAAIVLSPAVYVPLPPAASSSREFGAFGRSDSIFDETVYRANNYPALLPRFEATGLRLTMFIAVGDLEAALPNIAEASHDLDYEAHTLYNRLRRVPTIAVRFRVIGGGHNWETWRPTFAEGLESVFSTGADRERAPKSGQH